MNNCENGYDMCITYGRPQEHLGSLIVLTLAAYVAILFAAAWLVMTIADRYALRVNDPRRGGNGPLVEIISVFNQDQHETTEEEEEDDDEDEEEEDDDEEDAKDEEEKEEESEEKKEVKDEITPTLSEKETPALIQITTESPKTIVHRSLGGGDVVWQ